MWWLAYLVSLISWPLEYIARYSLSLAPLIHYVAHIVMAVHFRRPHYLWITPSHGVGEPPWWRYWPILNNLTNSSAPHTVAHVRPINVAP